jgi:hypothetical protein
MPVCSESFETTDRNWFTLLTTNTQDLALGFLWTNATTNSRQAVGIDDCLIGTFKIFFGYLGNKFRDRDIDRTASDARFDLAFDAATCL